MPTELAVFVGDSVTDAGRTSGVVGGLGNGYVREIARTIGRHTVNMGISGDRVRDLRRRWDADVISRRPDILTILVGINDTWRRYDSSDPTSTEDFERDYIHILDVTRSANVGTVILMEPFVVPVNVEQCRWRAEDLDAKVAVIQALGEQYSAPVVRLDRVLGDAAATYGAAAIAEDGVHPTPLGHRLIAEEWRRVALENIHRYERPSVAMPR